MKPAARILIVSFGNSRRGAAAKDTGACRQAHIWSLWHLHQHVRSYVFLLHKGAKMWRGAKTVGYKITKVSIYTYVLLRSRGAIMYKAPIHFGALCKSTYNQTTRPRQNVLGRQNVRFHVHRGAAAESSILVLFYCNYMLLKYFLFLSFSLLPPPPTAARGESPPLPPSVRH